ncbi:MAG: NAD(P)-dependent oxidoreductase [Phycisphaerales bacterium]
MPPQSVIQTEHLDPDAAAWLARRCQLVVCPSEDEPRFGHLLATADALLIRTYTQVNAALLARAPRLRAVARAGVGLDNVDQDACRARGIAVLSTPDANTRAVVEYVTSLMLDALRPRTRLQRALPTGEWKKLRESLIAPRQLSDLTFGILGLGRIGSQVARVAASLNMRVIFNDLVEIPTPRRCGAAPVPLDALLADADVLTIHVDGRAANRHFVGADFLASLKPDVLLINTSRGFVIDPPALAGFLRAHPAATAALDVHEPEPFDAAYPLLGIPNAVLTPHIAAATTTAHRNMSWVVKDLWHALSGEHDATE